MWLFTRRQRKEMGAAFAVLVVISAVFVAGALGFFSAELTRLHLARQQLSAVCDASALAGKAAMAAADPATPDADRQQIAINAAKATFQNNQILGAALATAEVSVDSDLKPVANQAKAKIEFITQSGSTATNVKVTGAFGLTPMTGTFLPIGTTIVTAFSGATIPKIDIVIAMDVTGSLDDNTMVQLEQKVPSGATTTTGSTTSGTMVHMNTYALAMDGMENETSTSGVPGTTWCPAPQEKSGWVYQEATTTVTDIVTTDEYWIPIGQADYLYKLIQPANVIEPQNLCDYTAANGTAYNFNADFLMAGANSTIVAGKNDYTYIVPADYTTDHVNLTYPSSEYTSYAASKLEPWNTVVSACVNFLDVFQKNADTHFGLVAYEGQTGSVTYNPTSPECTKYTGTTTYSLPLIPLSTGEGNYDSIQQSLKDQYKLFGNSTNLFAALTQAKTQLDGSARTGAKKVVVLFTDGVCDTTGTTAQATDHDTALADAKSVAAEIGKSGAQIFLVGLDQRGEYQSKMSQDFASITQSAGNGSSWYVVEGVDNASQLTSFFENIARTLVAQTDLAKAN